MRMKIRICQTSPKFFDIYENVNDAIEIIEDAKEHQVDLVVFPELSLTGYFVKENYHNVALTLESDEIQRLVDCTKDIGIVIGFIEESESSNFYNSALIAIDGKIHSTHRKLNLPNYGLFEERKYFCSGKSVPIFRHKGFNIAPMICNDLWHPSLPYLAVSKKADIILGIINSARESMGDEFSNIESWRTINTFYSRIFGVYMVCVNRVGTETIENSEFNFWGGSAIYDPFGSKIAECSFDDIEILDVAISRDILRKKKVLLPYLRDDDPYFTHRELTEMLYKTRDGGTCV
jgi:predicted amidohydrolase